MGDWVHQQGRASHGLSVTARLWVPCARTLIAACAWCLVGCSWVHLAASEPTAVDELVEAVVDDIPPDVLAEPGSTVFAEQLAELAAVDLGLSDQEELELQVRVAEAWLGADQSAQAEAAALAVLEHAPDREQVWRDRAGIVLVETWALVAERAAAMRQLEQADEPDLAAADDAEQVSVSQRLAALGAFSPEVVARARVRDGRRYLDGDQWELAQSHFDGAIRILEGASPRTRVPIYALRVLAMEAAGTETDAVLAWLNQREQDPAVELVLASLLTDSQKLVGSPAPDLELPYLDGEGQWRRVDHLGKVLVVYVFATWSQPCAKVTPAVVQIAQGGEADVIGLSLDNQDTLGALAAYRARFGLQVPIVGEALGWDGEADDQLHVESIPHLVVIGPDGRIRAVDLIQDTPQQTAAALRAAIRQLQAPAAGGAQEEFP